MGGGSGRARAAQRRTPVTGYPYLDAVLADPPGVLAFAHRGGAGHPGLERAENTMHAFRHAASLGYRYLETDVHATRDGTLVAFHDKVLDRVADRSGVLADLSDEELSEIVIAEEHGIPRMADLLEEFPEHRFNIDIKSASAVDALADLVDRTGAHDRVLVGSFHLRRIQRFRRLTRGRVATAAAPTEVATFLALPLPRLARFVTRARVAAFQVPRRRGPLPVVTPSFVRRAHAAGAHVHVWTVDDPAEMDELIDMGVDGLMTDRTDLLKDVLTTRGLWRDHA